MNGIINFLIVSISLSNIAAYASSSAQPIDKSQVAATVLGAQSKINSCYTNNSKASFSNEYSVELRIASSGEVTSSSVRDFHASAKNPQLQACITETVGSFKFKSDPKNSARLASFVVSKR